MAKPAHHTAHHTAKHTKPLTTTLRYDWVWASSYSPHGPVHAWVGGVGGGGCDEGSGQFDKLVGEFGSNTITRARPRTVKYQCWYTLRPRAIDALPNNTFEFP